jgi:hypothetical protein
VEAAIWQYAGIVGVNPLPLTLRELAAMADAVADEAWRHTAWLTAAVLNVFRTKGHVIQPDDVNPRRRAKQKMRRRPATKTELAAMKAAMGK